MRRVINAMLFVVLGSLAGCGGGAPEIAPSGERPYVLDHEAVRIDGASEALEAHKGSVLLIVNTASECGYTPQYEGLERLYRERKDDGLIVLGFPSNDFLGQEPGSNEEIAAFCSARFDVTFPMYEKVRVKGPDAHPLFAELTGVVGEPSWNFNKYLVDRSGRLVARYGSGTRPDSEALRSHMDALMSTRDEPRPETADNDAGG